MADYKQNTTKIKCVLYHIMVNADFCNNECSECD